LNGQDCKSDGDLCTNKLKRKILMNMKKIYLETMEFFAV